MTKASLCHITVQQMRLRWLETSEAHSSPLLLNHVVNHSLEQSLTHTPGLYGYKTIRVEVVRDDWLGERMEGIA